VRPTLDLIDALVQMNIVLPSQRNELIRRLRANSDEDVKLISIPVIDPLVRGLNRP